MKFLKSTIAIVALFAITAVNAKVMKRTQPTTGYTQPTIQPVIPTPYNKPLPAIPVVENPVLTKAETKAFNPNYLENIIDNVVETKGFAIKSESLNARKTRVVALVKQEIINDLTPQWEQDKIAELKNLVHKTLDAQIKFIVDKTLHIQHVARERASNEKGQVTIPEKELMNMPEEEMSEEEMNMRRG
jgi:hypothetical protein